MLDLYICIVPYVVVEVYCNKEFVFLLLSIKKLRNTEQPQSIESAKRAIKLTEQESIEIVRQASENGKAKLKAFRQEKREMIKERENSGQKKLKIAQEKGAKIRQKSEKQSSRLLNILKILKKITPISENLSNVVIQRAEKWGNHQIEKAKQKEHRIIEKSHRKNDLPRDNLIEELKKKTIAIQTEILEEVQTIRKKELIFLLSTKRELLALIEELNKKALLVEVTRL